MKKLLILGSDFGTLQVVREAHALGIYVIVADLMPTSPTKELADEAWLISTTDTDALIEKCREEGVCALMFGASDFNILNARKVCLALGLPIYCKSDYACRVARDKGEFKRICREVGAPVAQDYFLSDALTDEELGKVEFPVVVKPVDKSGNRGMSYCNNCEELIDGWRAAREVTDNEIIVERRLRGKEYNVHYVLADGEARLLYFSSTHNQPGESDNLYSFKCTTSMHLKQFIDEVNAPLIEVFRRAECRDGIVWVDCIRDDDGRFYLLEMGYRFGGVMTYVPYERVSGFNTVRWMLECAMGVEHKASDLPKALDTALHGCAASYNLFSKENGTIESVEGVEEILKIPGVYVDMPKREGGAVREYACMGLVGIYGASIEDVCSSLEKVNAALRVKNKDGENMFIIFNDYDSLREEYQNGLKEFSE